MSFAARYHGMCPSCGRPVTPGDPLRYTDDDDLVHDHCIDPDPTEPTTLDICPTCHLTRPCDCEGPT